MQKEVDDQTAELHLANRRKDQLFQLVGDNLRSPLQEVTALSNEIAHLPPGNSHKAFKTQAQRIRLTSFNLLNHLENLLEWARLKIKALLISPAKYVLADIVDPLLKRYRSFTDENRIAVHNNINANLSVYIDLDAITIVFRNLIAYAITNKKGSNYLNISAFENNSSICVTIEYARIDPQPNGTSEQDQDTKGHFAIQLCRQLLGLHGSQLEHRTNKENRELFEFKLKQGVRS